MLLVTPSKPQMKNMLLWSNVMSLAISFSLTTWYPVFISIQLCRYVPGMKKWINFILRMVENSCVKLLTQWWNVTMIFNQQVELQMWEVRFAEMFVGNWNYFCAFLITAIVCVCTGNPGDTYIRLTCWRLEKNTQPLCYFMHLCNVKGQLMVIHISRCIHQLQHIRINEYIYLMPGMYYVTGI